MHPVNLVKDAALRLLEDDRQFRAAVQQGIKDADRGEFVEDAEMDARVKRAPLLYDDVCVWAWHIPIVRPKLGPAS